MLHKIYIHHYFSNTLFYKLGHNTINKNFNINSNKVGNVTCEYNNTKLEFIFNPIINDNSDGYHLLDYFTAFFQKNQNIDYKNIDINGMVEDTPFLKRFAELTNNKENWLITFFRTEKVLGKNDKPDDWWVGDVETKLKALGKHLIISDNIFIDDGIRYRYQNMYFAFTNTIWQWNEIISIRWYFEFKELFDRLNFKYDLIYSVRHHKKHRIEILKGLAELENYKILLQRTDSLDNVLYAKYNNELKAFANIHLNKLEGPTDFSNLKNIEYHRGIAYDLFFRFLGRAKMQVLDESWAWSNSDFKSQYLSEKTIGLILSGIPFISTHSYPLEVLHKILDIKEHPFMNDFKLHKGNSKLFVKFVQRFMKNFDENYNLCKQWSDDVHTKFISKIESENSLLDLLFNGFKNENNLINANKRIL